MNLYLQIFVELFAFMLVVIVVIVAMQAFGVRLDINRRLSEETAIRRQTANSVVRSDKVENPVLQWVQTATSDRDSKDGQRLRRKLFLAGFEQPSAPVWYSIARFGLAIGMPLLFLISQRLVSKPVSGLWPIVIAIALCAVGFVAPHYFVAGRASGRSQQLEHEFPDALDLMVVCVEAGLGLEAAFIRVAQEIGESHPRMAECFNRLSDELRAGRSRAEALRSMADRTDVEPVRSFSALLIQTDALGTSIGQTLRTYASEMRDHRFLKAEEKAMRIPVLMTIPLVGCILPVIVGALLIPPIIDVIRTLVPALAGQHH
jgi:tight adherence protein C